MRNSPWKVAINGFVVLIGIASLVTTWFPKISVGNVSISGILTTITVLGISSVYFYNNSSYAFIFFRRFCAWRENGTVKWRVKYQTGRITDRDIIVLRDQLEGLLRDKGRIKARTKVNPTSTFVKYEYESKGGLESSFNLSWNKQEDGYFVVLKQSSQTSYRDVKRIWESFCEISDESFRVIPEADNRTLGSNANHSSYHLVLGLEKSPFYRLTLRTYDKPEKLSFTLRFKEGDSNIEVVDKQLTLTTPHKKEVDKVLKNYITLSGVY